MRTYAKFLLYLSLSGSLFFGCADELDIVPVSDITSSGFWNTEDDASAYLTGVYDKLRDVYNSTLYFEDRSDSFAPGDIGPVSEAWSQSLSASNAPDWNGWYNLVYHCNLLLKETEGITFREEETKNQIIAETYFIRAFAYYSMARIWGEVPLELTPLESADEELKPRASLEEVFQQIKSDINQSLTLFADNSITDRNRASRPAVLALQADVNMWTGKVLDGGQSDFETALSALTELESTGFTLLEGDDKQANYRSLFSSDNKTNEEVVFSLFFKFQEQDQMYATRLTTWGINVQGADNYSELPLTEANRARAVYAPSEKLRNLYAEYPEDVRSEIVVIDAITTDESTGVVDTILTCFNKFRGTVYDDRYFDDDIIVYRWGGLLLLKAEALAALNRVSEAVAELNKVRSRANVPVYSGATDKVTVERAILDERWRELVGELKRWPDLVRFHSGGTVNIYEEVPNLSNQSGYPLYFPVPQTVLDNNDLLTQTEGYQ
ncbi:MAG: RagB/SusD family nutrient uptake outer membrane protein [Cyclobacteriaceae bacterium]